MIEWIEPYGNEDLDISLICRITESDAIKVSRIKARNSHKFKDDMDSYSDQMALEDFMTTHWAIKIND